ncbi:MAG: septum formation initiator family protein [Clostridiales Family XIII bacterium]|jgi:cell division protein DivIC|nr:septum formation initiator family protein [Clostridiales Family XIII bacterium]
MEKVIDIEEAQRLRRKKREAAVSKMKVRAAAEAALETEIETPKSGVRFFAFVKGVILFAAAIVFIVFVLVSTVNLINLSKEAEQAQITLAEVEAEKAQVAKQLTLVNDPAFIEEQARQQLRMIRPGETLYVFGAPDDESAQ